MFLRPALLKYFLLFFFVFQFFINPKDVSAACSPVDACCQKEDCGKDTNEITWSCQKSGSGIRKCYKTRVDPTTREKNLPGVGTIDVSTGTESCIDWGSWNKCHWDGNFYVQVRWCDEGDNLMQIRQCTTSTSSSRDSESSSSGGGGTYSGYCSVKKTSGDTIIVEDKSSKWTASLNWTGIKERFLQNSGYVQFISKNTKVASISRIDSRSANINAKSEGDTTIELRGSGTHRDYSKKYSWGYKKRFICRQNVPITVIGEESCTLGLYPSTSTVNTGTDVLFTSLVAPIGGTVDRVDFSSSNSNLAEVAPGSDITEVYNSEATAKAVGNVTITSTAHMSGGATCSDTATIEIVGGEPWWQALDGDILSLGNIESDIPGTCTGACDPALILDGLGGFPGVAVYGGSLTVGEGDTSSTAWSANTLTSGRDYKYSYLTGLIPSDTSIQEITSPTITGATLASGGTESYGYYWYHFDGSTYGDLTITDDTVIPGDRKVVLLVEGGDLYINGKINIGSKGQGYFMAIVGSTSTGTKGDIFVDPSVGGTADGVPELEGFYLADSEFRTGAGDTQLHLRGSVATYDGISLERDLVNDSTVPAELFEYAPELYFLYPGKLAVRKMNWVEVLP